MFNILEKSIRSSATKLMVILVSYCLSGCWEDDRGCYYHESEEECDERQFGVYDIVDESESHEGPTVKIVGDLIGVLRCESNVPTLAESSSTLIQAGIDVISERCGQLTDTVDVDYEQCPLGVFNGIDILTIHPSNIEDAQAIETLDFISPRNFRYSHISCQ